MNRDDVSGALASEPATVDHDTDEGSAPAPARVRRRPPRPSGGAIEAGRLYRLREVAEHLDLSMRGLDSWRSRVGLPIIKLSHRCLRVAGADLIAALARSTTGATR